MPGRRAYFLWIEIWPQEVYFLTGLLIAVTSYLGGQLVYERAVGVDIGIAVEKSARN